MSIVPNNYDSRRELEKEVERIEAETSALRVEKPELPTVVLEEMKYDAPSDAYLAEQAERGLENYRKSGIAAIKGDSAANAQKLEASRDAYAGGMQSDVDAINAAYKTAAQNIDNDVLKRGLARSSIAVNAKSDAEAARASREAEVRAEYGKKLSALDAEIGSVDAKLREALNDFNLTYAAKLSEKLEGLKTERDEKAKSVLEYNNKIKAQQAELDAAREETEAKLYDKALEQRKKAKAMSLLSEEEIEEHYESVYDAMNEYLSKMKPVDAKKELNNHPFYREHLNDFYYYLLYSKYGRAFDED